MAASRDYIVEQQCLHPSRIQQIPGHLEDFVLTSQPWLLVFSMQTQNRFWKHWNCEVRFSNYTCTLINHSLNFQLPVQMPPGLLPQAQQPLSHPASIPVTEHHVEQCEPLPESAPAGRMYPPYVYLRPGDLQQRIQPQGQYCVQQHILSMTSPTSMVYQTVPSTNSCTFYNNCANK